MKKETVGIAVNEYWESKKEDVLKEMGISPVDSFINSSQDTEFQSQHQSELQTREETEKKQYT